MFGTKKPGWLGIDWGTRAIKLACIERDGNAYRWTRRAILRRAVDPAACHDGELASQRAWTCDDFPAGLVREGWFSRRRAACVLPMHWVDMRTLELPSSDPQVRRSIAAGELADALGEPASDRVFDLWDGLAGVSNRNASLVQCLSMPRDLAASVADALARSGLECEAIDGLPFTLGRAIDMAEGPSHAPRIALDWGFCGATICVLRGPVPIYSRQLRGCGLHRLASSLAESLAVTLIEAEEMLVDQGIPGAADDAAESTELQNLAAQVVAESFRPLIEQVDKTLMYVDHEWPGTLPDTLWLFGGGATIRNMPAYLTEKFGLKVRPWRLSPDGNRVDPQEPLFASAAALSALAWN